MCSNKLSLFLILYALLMMSCESNVNYNPEESTRSEKSIKTESYSVYKGDTTKQVTKVTEKNYSESEKNNGDGFSIKDKSGLLEQLVKKFTRENIDTLANPKKDTSKKVEKKIEKIKFKKSITCTTTLSDDELENYKEELRNIKTGDDKLVRAKIIFNDLCLQAVQARDLALIFTLEKHKLEFAKFSFGRVNDKPIFLTKFKNVFNFSNTLESLEEYVSENQ